MSDVPGTITASRFLRRAGAIALAGSVAVGVALWPANTPDPATPAQQAAARALMRCRESMCFATLRYADPAICAFLTSTNGGETAAPGGTCPGDAGHANPVAAQRAHRFLACAVRDGALDSWHAYPSPSVAGVCGVDLRMNRGQFRAWVNRLDAASSTAFVNTRRSLRPADLRRPGGGAVSTWEGVDPDDETDDSDTIDFSDPLDGGVP